MRRKITALSGAHFETLYNFLIDRTTIYTIWESRLMMAAEVPDDLVEPLRERDAAVNDDAGCYPVGETTGSLKKI